MLDELKNKSAIIVLIPILRKDIGDYTGVSLYRKTSLCTVIKGRFKDTEYILDDGIESIFNDGSDFYRPMAYITEAIWNEDLRFVEILRSQYRVMEQFIPKRNDNYCLGQPMPEEHRVHIKIRVNIQRDSFGDHNLAYHEVPYYQRASMGVETLQDWGYRDSEELDI